MARSRRANNLSLIAVALAVCSCMGGGNGDISNGGGTELVIVAGNNQSAAPGALFGSTLSVKAQSVLDGTPVPGIPIIFAQTTNTNSVISSPQVFTDNSGIAATTVRAADEQNVVVRVGASVLNGGSGPTFNLTVADPEDTEFYKISTNPSTLTAGVPFNFVVTIVDQSGDVFQNISENRTLTWQATSASSWGGIAPLLPGATVSCAFVNGVCQLATASTIMDALHSTEMFVGDSAGIAAPGSLSISVAMGTASRVAIATEAGGPFAGATVLNSSTYVSADDAARTYSAAITDSAGNYLGDASSVTWTGTTAALQSSLSGASGSTVVFTPATSTTGNLEASVSGLSTAVLPFSVNPGAPNQVILSASATPLSGIPFVLNIVAADAKGNALSAHYDTGTGGYTGAFSVTFTDTPQAEQFPGAWLSGRCSRIYCVAAGDTLWSAIPLLCSTSVNYTVEFVNGVAVTVINSVLEDLDQLPFNYIANIAAANGFSALSGSTSLTFTEGAAARVNLYSAAGSGRNSLCRADMTNNLNEYCLTYHVTGAPVTLYAAVEDQGGNYIASESVTWTAGGSIAGNLSVDASGIFATFTPSTVGVGNITLVDSARGLSSEYAILVNP